MNRYIFLVQVLLLTLFSLSVSAEQMPIAGNSVGKVIGAQFAEHPDWFKKSFLELAEDVAEAEADGKHVLLYFYLEGCPYCYKMVEENFKYSTYTDYLQANFDVIAINIRGDREVAFSEDISLTEKVLSQQLDVRFTPTLIFLSYENKPVLRLNGYRSVDDFKHALDFVVAGAYQHTTLTRYIEENAQEPVYNLRQHPNFVTVNDLSAVPDKPLMILFEDQNCSVCDAFHDELLALPENQTILDLFTVVRLDALSEQPIIDVRGKQTTPKAFAEALAISYRPGIVLFDQGTEILRIDGMQYRYHLQGFLRYVGERHYLQYPVVRDYMRAREQAILNSGQDIELGP